MGYMASLQELRQRQRSVKSTRKITQAMKMIAAAKLRKAQERAESGRPYANLMSSMVSSLLKSSTASSSSLDLINGRDKDGTRLIIVVTSNKGLCGGFNSSAVRRARLIARKYSEAKKSFRFFCIGKKGYSQLKFEYGKFISDQFVIPDKPSYDFALEVTDNLVNSFNNAVFDSSL